MRNFVCAALFALVTFAACSPPNVSQSDPNAACADYAYARCTHLATDCSPAYMLYRYGSDDPVSLCRTLITQSCINNLTGPGAGGTPSGIEACAQVIPTKWSCSDFVELLNPPPECAQPVGSLPSGAACATDGECQTRFCAVPLGNACGTCQQAPQPGSSCAGIGTCGNESGMTCESGTCVPFVEQGSACGGGQGECDPGAGLACVAGTCQPAVTTANAACASTPGCALVDGLVCNTELKTCQQAQFAGAGQPCGTVGYASIFCAGVATCLGASGNTPGTCAALSPPGGPCDLSAGPDCLSPTRCIVTSDGGTSGTCQFLDGSSCH